MVDKSWGVGDPSPGFRVRTNDSPADRAAARARDRDARARARSDAVAERLEARAAARIAAADVREDDRTARRAAAEHLAAVDPHAPGARRPRASGRKDVVREQRDTRGYTTLVDEDRIRTLALRGASIHGLASAFGIGEAEVERILAEAS